MPTQLKRYLSKYARIPLAQDLGSLCRRYLRWMENHNYDLATNGERYVLERLRNSGMKTLFDVGANLGTWTSMARGILPDAEVHCFEIVPEIAVKLSVMTRSDSGITVNQFGLGDAERDAVVKFYPESPGLSSLVDYPHPHAARTVAARIRRGDWYCREKSIEQVDFLKIDVEGAEELVLQGFADMMDRHRVVMIQFEYGRTNILQHFLLYDAYQLLTSHGFVVGKLYPDGVDFRPYSFDREDFLGPNYLAVQESRPDLIARLRSH